MAARQPSSAPVVACVQLAPVPGDLDGNRQRAVAAVAEAARAGATLIVLPELCTSGYAFAGTAEAAAASEPADGPTLAGWAAAAERHGVVVVGGFCERGPDERLYNAAAVVDPDGVRAVYRKIHLWDAEQLVFEPGDTRPPVVDTAGGRVGVAICYDTYFPELVRALVLDGAELIAVPTSSPLMGPPVEGLPMEVLVAMAAAHVNRVFVAIADRTGEEGAIAWAEASAIVDPSGTLLARPRPGPAVLLASCPLSRARDKRWGTRNDLLGDRRPDLYARWHQTTVTPRRHQKEHV